MKISVDGKDIFEIEPWQELLLKDTLMGSTLQEDMERRARWVWEHKVDQCFIHMEAAWMPILRKDPSVTSIPISKEDFVNMVVNRSDYKDREEREAEALSSAVIVEGN